MRQLRLGPHNVSEKGPFPQHAKGVVPRVPVSRNPGDLDHSVARRYGQVFAQVRPAGTPIPVNDIWIAAATLDCGGHLFTFDRHFEKIEGLDLTLLEA